MKKKPSKFSNWKDGNLPPQVLKFCVEYIVDRKGGPAWVRAGGSAKSADSQASRLLRNAKVKAEINRLIKEQEERTKLNGDRVLKELWLLGTVDISEAYDDDGAIKKLKDMPETVRRAIAGVEVEELFEGSGENRIQVGFTSKVKLFDKPRCLEMLAKHFVLLTDKHEISGPGGGPIVLKWEDGK